VSSSAFDEMMAAAACAAGKDCRSNDERVEPEYSGRESDPPDEGKIR
jgi:hypothetical protein